MAIPHRPAGDGARARRFADPLAALDGAGISRHQIKIMFVSEYSGKRSRGRMVGLVFAMQGAGLRVGPLAAAALLGSGVSHGAAWRILLALGAIPALSVFWLRRRINETPRFALAAGEAGVARAAIADATAARGTRPAPPLPCRGRPPQSIIGGFCVLVTSRLLLRWLAGTAGTWFLLDFAYYGNTVSSPEVLRLLSPQASLLRTTLVQLAIFAVFALPGYVLAIALLDKTGRRSIQLLGFGLMGAMFLLIGLVPGVTQYAAPFVVLYGVSYFFTEFGPNTTTFVYPAELFPVQVRTTGHGISTALGKMGAFAGAFLFPVMLASSLGIRGAKLAAALASLAGLALTAFLLPEPRGKSLEELSAQAGNPPGLAPAPARTRASPA